MYVENDTAELDYLQQLHTGHEAMPVKELATGEILNLVELRHYILRGFNTPSAERSADQQQAVHRQEARLQEEYMTVCLLVRDAIEYIKGRALD